MMRHRIVTNGRRFRAQTEIDGEWHDEMEGYFDGYPVSAVKHRETVKKQAGYCFHNVSEFRSRGAAKKRIVLMYGMEVQIEQSPWVQC